MTEEMERLHSKLHTVKVKNVVGAYGYLVNEINKMDMNGTLSFELTPSLLKNVKKDLKILKKFYKGKTDIDPKSLTMKYKEDTQEHFFFKCLVELMQYNVR